MPFPNYPDKYSGTPVLTGKDMLAYRREIGQFPAGAAPRSMIVCVENGLPKLMRHQYPYRKVGRVIGDLLALKRLESQIGVIANFGLGAPAVAALTEELAAWGVENFILISMAGGLGKGLKEGDLVLCERAIRDDGASHHYLPDEKFALPDEGLTTHLADALRAHGLPLTSGATWTTSAAYRETREEIRAYQGEGVQTVDMETAALFAVGQVFGVRTAAAYVVGDSLADLEWKAPTDWKAIERSFAALYSAVVETLKDL